MQTKGNTPLVTVIVTVGPTHLHLLPRALDSILRLCYPCFEVVVADDGCDILDPDCCRNAAHVYADRAFDRGVILAYLSCGAIPRGVGHASHEAVKIARGSYVIRIDADDTVDPNFLGSLVEALTRARHNDLQIAFAYGDLLKVWDDPEQSSRREILTLDRESVLDHGAGVLFWRDAILQVGNYNPEERHAEDHDLLLRLRKAGYESVKVFLDRPGYRYHQHHTNTTRDQVGRAAAVAEIRRRVGYATS